MTVPDRGLFYGGTVRGRRITATPLNVMHMLGYEDALDGFGVHAVGVAQALC
jgi:hypothetical protein